MHLHEHSLENILQNGIELSLMRKTIFLRIPTLSVSSNILSQAVVKFENRVLNYAKSFIAMTLT